MRIHPAAADDAEAAYRWYDAIDPALARDLRLRLREALARVDARPRSFAPHYAGTRRAALDDFPYGVVFSELDGEVHVIAIAHERRRPGYWSDRA